MGPLCFALSPWDRLRGLKALGGFSGNLVLAPCRDVHTFGMGELIDVAFLDQSGVVIEVHIGVPPYRRLRCKNARIVVERFSESSPWLRKDDSLGLLLSGALERRRKTVSLEDRLRAKSLMERSALLGIDERKMR